MVHEMERRSVTQQPVRFAIVGGGKRSAHFLRVAASNPELFEVTSVNVRSPAHAAQLKRDWNVATNTTLSQACETGAPDFVLVAVPRESAPELINRVVDLGQPVLVETPPAPSVQDLSDLWARVGSSGRVQVAEQSIFMPGHLARLRAIEKGIIGKVTSVQVSSNHEYHAVAVMRSFMQLNFEAVNISAHTFESQLIDPISFGGYTGDLAPKTVETTIAILNWGPAMGLYDFTTNQWFNPLRRPRITIRGSHGEISGDRIIRMADERTTLESDFVRRSPGPDFNEEGFDLESISLEGEVLYRNDFYGSRLSDNELAIAELLRAMGGFARNGGVGPYPLSQGMQDHLIGQVILEATKAAGSTLSIGAADWAADQRS